MKLSSRIAAILLAALLILVSLPLAAGAAGGEAEPSSLPYSYVGLDGAERVSPSSVTLTELDEAVNVDGVYLHYTTSQPFPFTPGGDGEATWGECGNTGVNNSVSSITAEYYSGSAPNQIFYFSVYYSTEEGHDFFTFSINGEVVAVRSGEETDDASGLFNYSMLLERNTSYVFTWSYTKDGSGAGGNDCVRLMDVYLSRHLDTSTAAAVNVPGCPIAYKPRGDYPGFVPCEFEGRTCAAPGCMHDWRRTSSLDASLGLREGDVVSFDYYCGLDPDEEQNGRSFVFGVDNRSVLTVRQSTEGWQTFSYTVTEDDAGDSVVLLSWGYSKSYGVSDDESDVFIDNISVTYNSPRDLNAQLNAEGSHLEFTSGTENPFVCYDEHYPAYTSYAVSGNRYIDDSVSSVKTTAHFLAGEMLVFGYYISGEEDDMMLLKVNGELLASESGTDREEFRNSGVIFYEEGDYEIEWSYVKDGSVSRGDDCLKLANVYTAHTLDTALNVPGGRLSFYTSIEYPFVPVEDGERLYAQSTNRWDNQIGALACDIYMRQGDTLSFEYWLDSLQGYDGLVFAVNGDIVMQDSGEYQCWQDAVYTCAQDGIYQFEWIFVQGDFTHSDINCVRIDNVSFSGVMPLFGDPDGNGVVNIADALLALRAAMGLIALDDYQTFTADVNGNGAVDMEDALMILRFALGLI